jgi:hypothetical protein
MKAFKTFEEFLSESSLFESFDSKKKSKIHPDLDNLLENKWRLATLKREYKKKNSDAWEKNDEKIDEEIGKLKDTFRDDEGNIPDDKRKEVDQKIRELRRKLRNDFVKDVISKDSVFKDEVTDYYKKQDRFEDLGNKLNDVGFEKFKKENAKEYEELLDLQANHMNPLRIISKPGGVMQISTTNMERGGDDGKPGHVQLPPEVGAEAFQRQMKNYIDKNGKPKGVIMDLRTNTGGSQDIAKAMTDFFVDEDEYDIEAQKFNWGVRRFKDDPDGLEKYKKTGWDEPIIAHLETLSPDDQKKYWEESKEKGFFQLPNKRKNQVDAKYRLTNIPTVLETSVKTFSAGEFATDTIKNLNPNAMHIGNNSGGGANQTWSGLGMDEFDNVNKSSTEKAKMIANAFKNAYHDEEQGKQVHDKIIKQLESGEITDKTSTEDMIKVAKDSAFGITKDAHVDISILDDGNMHVGVPQIRSDRVVVDPKTRKPILKDGKPQYKGNWEQSGVGQSGTGPFVESDPETATRDALEFIYKKTGQTKLVKELKTDPEKFGISKDGRDGVYDGRMEAHQSYFVNHGDQRQADQLKKSIETAKQNAKEGLTDKMLKADAEFTKDAGKEEIKNLKDTGATKMFSGIKDEIAQKLKDMKVMIAMPGGKKKTIQTETLMDFVPIDPNDPEEQAMIKAQAMQYARINALRVKMKKKELVAFEQWLKRNIELAKDNKDYQARIKAKTLGKMKKASVKENFVYSFDHYLVEEENNKVFESIINESYQKDKQD